MKIKITKADGTVIEAEGTAEECQQLVEPSAPKLPSFIELEDIRKLFAEEFNKPRSVWWFNPPYPYYVYPYVQPSTLPYWRQPTYWPSVSGTSGFYLTEENPSFSSGTVTQYPTESQFSWTGEKTY